MPAPLSVWDIAAHLGVQDWQVSRQCGRPNGIPAVKTLGPGASGRGGRWRVTRADYYRWLGLPKEDVPAPGAPLPPVRLLTDIAAEYGIDVRRLRHRWRREVAIGRGWSRGDGIVPASGLARTLEIARDLKRQGYVK